MSLVLEICMSNNHVQYSLLFIGGDGDSKDVKRLKSSVGIDGITVRWEWEGDGGKWTSYAPSHNEAITEAFNDDQKEVGLSHLYLGSTHSLTNLFYMSDNMNTFVVQKLYIFDCNISVF